MPDPDQSLAATQNTAPSIPHLRAADPALQGELDKATKAAAEYQKKAYAENTVRAYGADWRKFEAFCDRFGLSSMPAAPEVVATYLAYEAEAGLKVATIDRRLAGIRLAHLAKELEPPTNSELVRSVMRGIRNEHGKEIEKKAPVVAGQVLAMANAADLESLAGLRDRALLLLGFAAALRRSELVAVQVPHLEFVDDDLVLTIPRSKTDQGGKGVRIPVRAGDVACPVAALRAWLSEAGITEGPVFRRVYRGGRTVGTEALSAHSVALIVKRYAQLIGISTDTVAGHSLRSGFLTSAARNRARLDKMMEVSRHKEPRTVLDYVQDANRFDDHAAEGMFDNEKPR